MKGLPIGKQHLELFVSDDLIYVDKTPLIYKLIEKVNFYFFSRPRRFGKSLLVDTMKNIFLGNQHLFKETWIYDKIEWKEHPVIHLDFSRMSYEAMGLDEAISRELRIIAKTYQVDFAASDIGCKALFRKLIEKLSEKGRVALLIDEYDKPITDYITDLPKANANRETLREFYGVLKPLGDKLQIVFITGIAKFARVSLFSVLNNLTDITLDEEYTTICGITQQELEHYFGDYLQRAEADLNIPREQLMTQIREMYDGYSWDGVNFVYNPFSLLNFLRERRFKIYWFRTGTPTFLVNILRKQRVDHQRLKHRVVEDYFFDTFNIQRGIDPAPLLFQAGYSTIQKVEFRGTRTLYTLGYPNHEVERSLVHNLIEAYTFKDPSIIQSAILELENALYQRDITGIQEQLNVFFADLSYLFQPYGKKDPDEERLQQEFVAWEGWFHTVIHFVLQFLGLNISCEVTKHRGRIDAVVEVADFLYLMEFKLADAETGLQQIKDRDYARSYRNSPKEVVLMGIAFDQKKREVQEIEWEVWDRT